jgi:hypothetical protein
MAIHDTQLLYSQNNYTLSINTNCWVLYIWTNSCFESNHSWFKIGTLSVFNLVGTTMQLGTKTFTPIKFSTTCKTGGSNSGPYCCLTNTTTSSNCLAKCTCHENYWMTIGSTKYTNYNHSTYYWNCINLCILSIGWTWVQERSFCGW